MRCHETRRGAAVVSTARHGRLKVVSIGVRRRLQNAGRKQLCYRRHFEETTSIRERLDELFIVDADPQIGNQVQIGKDIFGDTGV